jgi:hypothetical protein
MKTTQQQSDLSIFTSICGSVSVVARRLRRRILTPGCEVL